VCVFAQLDEAKETAERRVKELERVCEQLEGRNRTVRTVFKPTFPPTLGDSSLKTSINISINFFMQDTIFFVSKIGFRLLRQGCGVGGKISDHNSEFPKFPTLTFLKFPTPIPTPTP